MLRAPAKLNLCLRVGAVRADGLHELRPRVLAARRGEPASQEAHR